MPFSQHSLPPRQPPSHAVARLGLALAALAAAAAGPALADTVPTPINGVYTTTSYTETEAFATPKQSMATANAYATEVIGRLGGGPVLYDMVIPDAFGSASVQAALAMARAAVVAAGGPGTTVAAPSLLSSSTVANTASSSAYSLDPSTPIPAQRMYTGIVTSNTVLNPATVTLGPATINFGILNLCSVSTLPSATAPTCGIVNSGTFQIGAGQVDVNIPQVTSYLIDTTTTTTTTTTLTQAYALVGTAAAVPAAVPEPASLALLGMGGLLSLAWPRKAG